MTEALAAFVGSIIGVAIGTFAVLHCGRKYEARQALARQAAKAAHPSGRRVIQGEAQASDYNPRRWSA